jgi:hypothetical protein
VSRLDPDAALALNALADADLDADEHMEIRVAPVGLDPHQAERLIELLRARRRQQRPTS